MPIEKKNKNLSRSFQMKTMVYYELGFGANQIIVTDLSQSYDTCFLECLKTNPKRVNLCEDRCLFLFSR